MSVGILVKNTFGHILISSEIESLHCAGIASYAGLQYSGLTNFPDYSPDDGQETLSGRCIHRYSFNADDTPIFFIKPANISLSHGILNQWKDGATWYVDVIQQGGNPYPPKIFVFTRPASLVSNDDYGIKTRLADGRTAFDSRLKPLAIVGADAVMAPVVPCDGGLPSHSGGYDWNDDNLDFDFRSATTYNQYAMAGMPSPERMMFSAPSVAQAVYSRVKQGYKNSCGNYDCQSHWSTAVWWAMYHQTYWLLAGAIRAGWSVYAAGHYFYSSYEDGGWFGGDGGSAVSGSAPYDQKTINLYSNTIMVADASFYE